MQWNEIIKKEIGAVNLFCSGDELANNIVCLNCNLQSLLQFNYVLHFLHCRLVQINQKHPFGLGYQIEPFIKFLQIYSLQYRALSYNIVLIKYKNYSITLNKPKVQFNSSVFVNLDSIHHLSSSCLPNGVQFRGWKLSMVKCIQLASQKWPIGNWGSHFLALLNCVLMWSNQTVGQYIILIETLYTVYINAICAMSD